MEFNIDDISKNITNEMNYVKKWIAKRTAMKMRNKLIRVYESIIDDFYSRPAKYYYRHDVENQHTTEGINLYRAVREKMNTESKRYPSPNTIDGGISISSEEMSGYRYHIPKQIVLDYILDGIRFPSTVTNNGIYKPAMLFTSSYRDTECSATGTPLEVLESVKEQLADKYASEAKEEAKRELKLKYIKIS